MVGWFGFDIFKPFTRIFTVKMQQLFKWKENYFEQLWWLKNSLSHKIWRVVKKTWTNKYQPITSWHPTINQSSTFSSTKLRFVSELATAWYIGVSSSVRHQTLFRLPRIPWLPWLRPAGYNLFPVREVVCVTAADCYETSDSGRCASSLTDCRRRRVSHCCPGCVQPGGGADI